MMTKTLDQAQAELNAEGFWCTFKKHRTVMHVSYTPQQDNGISRHVATFNRPVDQSDIDRLVTWKMRIEAEALLAS